ncbi:HAD family hydrolase [Nesterenkonia muleiensis]|uniref:HAD family hydrolase n=1 Tax=Nesterenkonia muleiensis TaxID=2282648 RepID=UPI000E70C020|nr:HAD family hydrolase [Nesterenkonia muleiensis]
MHKLLLLDFDGTLCLGEDPILAYAGQVDAELDQRGLPGPGGRGVHEVVAEALADDELLVQEIEYDPDAAEHEAGVTPLAAEQEPATGTRAPHPSSWPLQDGYQLVQLLAMQSGLTHEETGHAFRQARRTLLAAGLASTDLHAPAEAAPLLNQLRGAAGEAGVVVVLLTNAPAEDFGAWLEVLGLQSSFDAVTNSAQKPVGMPQAVERARQIAAPPVPPAQILSVGDIWANDLAHVDELGGQTILIDRFGTGLGSPSHRVRSFAEAAPVIRRWAG